jgi:cellulose synthase/poly-beta-1,6-N-acetylglucosamine synthase-like glycosyltransferase
VSDAVEKPRVTFALLSYNQELIIREAGHAAAAQDYPNLEIVGHLEKPVTAAKANV